MSASRSTRLGIYPSLERPQSSFLLLRYHYAASVCSPYGRPLSLSKRNDLGACCAHESETDTGESAQRVDWKELKITLTLLRPSVRPSCAGCFLEKSGLPLLAALNSLDCSAAP